MFLTNADLVDLVAWRRKLHAMPELSGEEIETALEVASALASTGPDHLLRGLGGHGVAAVYAGSESGPTVMIRAELDGLPIEDTADVPHRSRNGGRGHQCGHDGHMAILMAVARSLSRRRPKRGRVVLLFQPAEENGAGAAAVVADPRYGSIRPDFAFACHNMPGMPLGRAAIVDGPLTCASRGMRIALTGRTAHASMPETGLSPVPALAALATALPGLSQGALPSPDFAMVTVTHMEAGERVFGIAAGQGEIWATLRTLVDSRMEKLRAEAEGLTRKLAGAAGLGVEITYRDVFAGCVNDREAAEILRHAFDEAGIAHDAGALPLRGAEDFGGFGLEGTRLAMFLIGAGEGRPHLHNPDYDFPDDLIGIGARIFGRVLRILLG